MNYDKLQKEIASLKLDGPTKNDQEERYQAVWNEAIDRVVEFLQEKESK
jgi:hypothetical protein